MTLRGSKTSNTFFSPLDVQLFHDGSHLHAKTVLLASLFDDDYTLGKREEDALILNLYQGEKGILSHQIPIKVPWPVEKRSSQVEKMLRYAETPEELLAVLQKLPGWTHFKQRLEENVTRFHVGSLRRKAGLPSNAPDLYRHEHRNYDTEGNIVRALCDVLDNTAEYPRNDQTAPVGQ